MLFLPPLMFTHSWFFLAFLFQKILYHHFLSVFITETNFFVYISLIYLKFRQWTESKAEPSTIAIRNCAVDGTSGCCVTSNKIGKKWKVKISMTASLCCITGYLFYCFFDVFSELLDGCRALLSVATVTNPLVFDELLKSLRSVVPYLMPSH